MSAQIDCPICMETIELDRNCVKTECGHCFHTNCLMKSVAHNGFGCPYCRTKMADKPEEEDDESMYSVIDDDDEMFEENALRGFRIFWNNINGEDYNENDNFDEEQIEQEYENAPQYEENQNIPSASFITRKLQERGVSYEQLVKTILLEHDEYNDDDVAYNFDNELFGIIRIIMSNYTHEETVQLIPESVEQIEVNSLQATTENSVVDFEAQLKPSKVRLNRDLSCY